jgi:hypothetical protein
MARWQLPPCSPRKRGNPRQPPGSESTDPGGCRANRRAARRPSRQPSLNRTDGMLAPLPSLPCRGNPWQPPGITMIPAADRRVTGRAPRPTTHSRAELLDRSAGRYGTERTYGARLAHKQPSAIGGGGTPGWLRGAAHTITIPLKRPTRKNGWSWMSTSVLNSCGTITGGYYTRQHYAPREGLSRAAGFPTLLQFASRR